MIFESFGGDGKCSVLRLIEICPWHRSKLHFRSIDGPSAHATRSSHSSRLSTAGTASLCAASLWLWCLLSFSTRAASIYRGKSTELTGAALVRQNASRGMSRRCTNCSETSQTQVSAALLRIHCRSSWSDCVGDWSGLALVDCWTIDRQSTPVSYCQGQQIPTWCNCQRDSARAIAGGCYWAIIFWGCASHEMPSREYRKFDFQTAIRSPAYRNARNNWRERDWSHCSRNRFCASREILSLASAFSFRTSSLGEFEAMEKLGWDCRAGSERTCSTSSPCWYCRAIASWSCRSCKGDRR